MIFTRYSLQFERALKNLTLNTERATKKQNAFWAGFTKKEESYYFFPDLVILINNEPSLKTLILKQAGFHELLPFPTKTKGDESFVLAPEYFISKKTLGSVEPLPTLRKAPILFSSAQDWSLIKK